VFPGSGSKAAKVFPGSCPPPRSSAAAYHEVIVAKLERGLSVQRIWQDLVECYGYGHSYESVKRYVRGLKRTGRVVGVYHSAPGQEGQIDFFRGAPTLHPESGQWRRPHVFRMTLGCSRHGYEEAVWDQRLETFLRCHENAFIDFGGVPEVIRHDNLKSGVVRACLYDPDVHDVYCAFAEHWGFVSLPTRPRNPQESGKQERSGGYVKDNALKGRRFESLDEQNAHLRRWNRTIARLRIHGTTRKQVWAHFIETEKPALKPIPAERFAFFESGTRVVHQDGHVEVRGAFYPAPVHLVGQRVRIRHDASLVKLYHDNVLVTVHVRQEPGCYAPRHRSDPAAPSASQERFMANLLGRCERVGDALKRWADEALEERGVRAIRLIQGVLRLTREHPRERLLQVAEIATTNRLFRYRDIKRLAEHAAERTTPRQLTVTHDAIRSMDAYRLEDDE
jgi:transposase